MAYVAKKDNVMLMILQDDDPQHPRKDWDNSGTMVCWHSRYNLGDEHEFDEPYRFFEEYLYEHESSDVIIKFAKDSLYIDLTYDRRDNGYSIYNRESLSTGFYKYEFIEGSMKDIKDELALSLLGALPTHQLQQLFQKNNLLLPLYLYDHSGITMNTTGFTCKWDSGQVGFIYQSHKDIKEHIPGHTFKEKLNQATENLIQEVKTYDCYLTGETYGFKYFENGEESDSCWGFFGDGEDLKKSIAEYLPNDAKDLIEDLTFINENETAQYEQEYEEEMEVSA